MTFQGDVTEGANEFVDLTTAVWLRHLDLQLAEMCGVSNERGVQTIFPSIDTLTHTRYLDETFHSCSN